MDIELAQALKELSDLKKENAELKKKLGVYQIGMFNEIEKRDVKLRNAKIIIKELIYADGRFADSYPQLINIAEQFLKE